MNGLLAGLGILGAAMLLGSRKRRFSGFELPVKEHAFMFRLNFDDTVKALKGFDNKTCKDSFHNLLEIIARITATGKEFSYFVAEGDLSPEEAENLEYGFNVLLNFVKVAADSWLKQCKARGMYRRPFPKESLPVIYETNLPGKANGNSN
jgi:hypothetical protein